MLCLDLDETLVSSRAGCAPDGDFTIRFTAHNSEYVYSVIRRPGLGDFLLSLAELYELAIFTYSIKQYADQIIQHIDQHNLIKYKFYREHCARYKINDRQFIIVKDLSRIGVPMDRVLLVDNTKSAGMWQPNNFILVESFFGDPHDRQLELILPGLKKLAAKPSIYKELERKMRE